MKNKGTIYHPKYDKTNGARVNTPSIKNMIPIAFFMFQF